MGRIEEALRRAGAARTVEPFVPRRHVHDEDNPFVSPWHGESHATNVESKAESAAATVSVSAPPLRPLLKDAGLLSQPPGRPTVRLESQLALHWPQPFAASVAGKLIVMHNVSAEAVEQYKRLAESFSQSKQGQAKSVLITSASRGEGKTLTATNLAFTLSESQGQRVLLVDGNLSQPGIHEVFQVSAGSGLLDLLRSPAGTRMPLIDLTRTLSLLPAGRATAEAKEAITSERMCLFLEEAASSFDRIVIDSESLDQSNSASVLAASADFTVLVIDALAANEAAVERAIDALGRDRLSGFVINRAHGSR